MQNDQLKNQLENALNVQLGAQAGELDEKFKSDVISAFSDEDFVKKFANTSDEAEVQALLKGKGIDVDLDAVREMKKSFQENLSGAGELSDDQMEQAAGGFVMVGIGAILAYKAAVLIAGAVGAYVGAKAVSAGIDYVKEHV